VLLPILLTHHRTPVVEVGGRLRVRDLRHLS
jgi:hypothetical protein